MATFGIQPTQLGRAIKPPGPRPVGAKLTGVKTPPAPLSGRAIAGNHPNWYGPPQATGGAAPLSGQAIAANHPNWYGPQGAGGFSGGVGLAPAKPQTAPQPTPPKASGTTTAPPASPLDSTYYANLAANQFRVNNQINSLTAQGQNSATNLQDALAQLAYQKPRDQLNVEENANRRGALYSSVEGQQQGNLLNQYQTKQSGLTRANSQRQAAIGSQISGLRQGEPLYAAGQYDAAVARAVKAALANPATGQAPISTPAPGGAGAAAAPAPGGAGAAAAPPGSGGRQTLDPLRVHTLINGKPAPTGTIRKNGALNINVPRARRGQIGYRGGF